MNDVKNAAVENIANVIDILDCSIASKKVIQCKAIIRPGKENFNSVLRSILILFFFYD